MEDVSRGGTCFTKRLPKNPKRDVEQWKAHARSTWCTLRDADHCGSSARKTYNKIASWIGQGYSVVVSQIRLRGERDDCVGKSVWGGAAESESDGPDCAAAW